jgi:hypothetical protein
VFGPPLSHPSPLSDPCLLRRSRLAQADAEEFQRILKKEFGEEVALPEAWNRLHDLVTLVRMLLGPLPEDPGGVGGIVIHDQQR